MNTFTKKSLKSYSYNELINLLSQYNVPKFRAKQLYEWLYLHHVSTFDEMTNLPKALRDTLANDYSLSNSTIIDTQKSKDGTRKYLIQLEDGYLVETVGIPSQNGQRLTVCFSTQVGCPMQCAFCATGKEGFTRNLLPGEICDQILLVQDDFQKRVTNIVGMGQGEPFLNYDNTLKALEIINDPKVIGIGARHITLSTCGIIPKIHEFSNVKEQFTLAVSLHSAIQSTRDSLMPKVSQYNLEELKDSLVAYVEATGRRVTLEYAMMRGVNDTNEHLKALIAFCSGLLCHVNLIPLNEIPDSEYLPSTTETGKHWIDTLESHHIETTLRNSKGSDIAAACGQLKNTFTQ